MEREREGEKKKRRCLSLDPSASSLADNAPSRTTSSMEDVFSWAGEGAAWRWRSDAAATGAMHGR